MGAMGRSHKFSTQSGPSSEQITREICLLPYEMIIKNTRISIAMAAFADRPSGLDWDSIPAHYSKLLLQDVLRDEWGFTGHVTEDWNGLKTSRNLYNAPKMSSLSAVALGIEVGIDAGCGGRTSFTDGIPILAVNQGVLEEKYVTRFAVNFGIHSPSGKLPYTWAKPEAEPVYYNHSGEISYDESVYLWPFGYGLSYTSFAYSNLVVTPKSSSGESITVQFDITNTGSRAGKEIGQVYIRDLKRSIEYLPVKQLAGFQKLEIDSGKTATAQIQVAIYQLGFFDDVSGKMKRIVEAGDFEILVGGSRVCL
jgi:hypothetical protein